VKTALLVMDVQSGIVERFDGAGLIERLGSAMTAARAADMAVIFVRIAFRTGYPEANPTNRSFAAIASRGDGFTLDSPATLIHPGLDSRPEDSVVLKKRVSAFAGSDLEILLRSRKVSNLVLTGIATSGVVLSTLREAADKDYELTVLSDGCLDADEEVHRVLMTKVFPRQADVVTVEEWIATVC